MLKFIYVDILPIVLVNICDCNKICITFQETRHVLSLEADLRTKRL